MNSISVKQWKNLTISCGLFAFASYFLAAFAPLIDNIVVILAFAFGPLFMLSSLGLYYILRNLRDTIILRIAILFNIVATAMVTMMLVVQLTLQEFHRRFKGSNDLGVSHEQLKWIFKEVNAVQLGMDLSWDIFISLGTFFFSLAMFRIPQMNKIISTLGMIFSFLLLTFNIIFFPEPPTEGGSIDFGPFVAIWYITLFGWLLAKKKSFVS
jgi:hypothetical protein